jgi:hypothetical protein
MPKKDLTKNEPLIFWVLMHQQPLKTGNRRIASNAAEDPACSVSSATSQAWEPITCPS